MTRIAIRGTLLLLAVSLIAALVAVGWGPIFSDDVLGYLGGKRGYYDLYLLDTDRGLTHRLTADGSFGGEFSWSLDGASIAYIGTSQFSQQVYLMDATGWHKRQLTGSADGKYGLAWSPDGLRLAFVYRAGGSENPGDTEIAVIEPESGAFRNVSQHAFDDDSPIWSPDSRWIAFRSLRNRIPAPDERPALYLVDVDGAFSAPTNTDPARRLAEGEGDIFDLVWSPDGKTIAFTASHEDEVDLYLADVSTGAVSQLTHDGAIESELAWSPGGDQLAFVSNAGWNTEIYVLELASGGLTQLTDAPGWDSSPAWSPDGQWIAFISWRLGGPRLFVISALGGEARNLVWDSAEQFSPLWRP